MIEPLRRRKACSVCLMYKGAANSVLTLPWRASIGTHLENGILINGFDSLRSRPGVRFAPSGLRTVLDERYFVAQMEPAGRAKCASRRRNPGRSLKRDNRNRAEVE